MVAFCNTRSPRSTKLTAPDPAMGTGADVLGITAAQCRQDTSESKHRDTNDHTSIIQVLSQPRTIIGNMGWPLLWRRERRPVRQIRFLVATTPTAIRQRIKTTITILLTIYPGFKRRSRETNHEEQSAGLARHLDDAIGLAMYPLALGEATALLRRTQQSQ